MTADVFDRIVVPVASESDAESTARALRPYLPSESGTVVLVHVVEKAGGAPDKISVEQAEEYAEDVFSTAIETLGGTDAALETRTTYGTDIAERIVETAAEENATGIVFLPRDSGFLSRLVEGDIADSIFDLSDLPVVVLPDSGDDAGGTDA
jgi:nucleotide-binding universal stress UspA family protein